MSSCRALSPDADIDGIFTGSDRSESPVSRPVSPFRGISPVNFTFGRMRSSGYHPGAQNTSRAYDADVKSTKITRLLMLDLRNPRYPAIENRARAVKWITEVRIFPIQGKYSA